MIEWAIFWIGLVLTVAPFAVLLAVAAAVDSGSWPPKRR